MQKDTGKLGDIAPTGYLQTELSKVSAENANLKTQLEAGATNMGQELRRKDSLIQSLEMKLRDMESEMGRLRIAEVGFILFSFIICEVIITYKLSF